ncbi:unnamed protein product [Trichogramma brassicae]|uniref:Uncharacterized protein n=1 Tax=Trichogramma brassicae TaxID=86971 RepID=A0A6H5I9E5_9HYME|nr:unnamed protein product [Trichogramma brassicae]
MQLHSYVQREEEDVEHSSEPYRSTNGERSCIAAHEANFRERRDMNSFAPGAHSAVSLGARTFIYRLCRTSSCERATSAMRTQYLPLHTRAVHKAHFIDKPGEKLPELVRTGEYTVRLCTIIKVCSQPFRSPQRSSEAAAAAAAAAAASVEANTTLLRGWRLQQQHCYGVRNLSLRPLPYFSHESCICTGVAPLLVYVCVISARKTRLHVKVCSVKEMDRRRRCGQRCTAGESISSLYVLAIDAQMHACNKKRVLEKATRVPQQLCTRSSAGSKSPNEKLPLERQRRFSECVRDSRVANLICSTRVRTDDYSTAEHNHRGDRFIDFVARSGYRDEPDLDENGKPLFRRRTALHRTKACELDVVKNLFKIYHRYDVNYTDEYGMTHFHVACEYGCDEIVKKFLELGQDPNCFAQRSVDPPLHLALQYKQEHVVKLLLINGANPNMFNKDRFTPLHQICLEKEENDDFAQMLFELSQDRYRPLQVNTKNKFGDTPLHLAMYKGHKKLTETLLRNGADPNIANSRGLRPLQFIFVKSYGDDFLELFFELGGRELRLQLNAVDCFGRSPLHWAVISGLKKVFELLLKNGADPNLASNNGDTPLHLISDEQEDSDDFDKMTMLFELSHDDYKPLRVNAQNVSGKTPLLAAVTNVCAKATELLLRRGADPNLADKNKLAPLHIICFGGNDDLATTFFKINDELNQTVQIDARDKNGNTPLHLAIFYDNPNLLEMLLVRGADLNSLNKDGLTPLHSICNKEEEADDLAKRFFEIGEKFNKPVRIDSRDIDGNTPLHVAIHKNHVNLIGFLLRKGADPNSPNKNGETPLHRICEANIDDLTVEMIFKICDEKHHLMQVDAQDKRGKRPLHVAIKNGNIKLVEILMGRGADPNSATNIGLTPLHYNCKRDVDEDVTMKRFFEIGNNVNKPVQVDPRDKFSYTPLHWAMKRGHKSMVELLLRKGADPHSTNDKGETPLHIVCAKDGDDFESVNKFFDVNDELARPVRVDARDKSGRTPLYRAVLKGHKRVTISLLRRGANPNLADEKGLTPLHVICEDHYDDCDLLELLFKISKEVDRPVQVDVRDDEGRTPLQRAVASLLPGVFDVLMNHGADLSGFVFPKIDCDEEWLSDRINEIKFKLTADAQTIVQRLERRGYELDRSDALKMMKFFSDNDLFRKSSNLEKFWYDDEELVGEAKEIMINPTQSLHDLIQMRPKEAAKSLARQDYINSVYHQLSHLPAGPRSAFTLYLCEIKSREFFQSWALDCFMELIHNRLPILCCEKIMEHLGNEDLYNICLAAAGLKLDVSSMLQANAGPENTLD